eukprot:394869-Amphidinium_carterae.1
MELATRLVPCALNATVPCIHGGPSALYELPVWQGMQVFRRSSTLAPLRTNSQSSTSSLCYTCFQGRSCVLLLPRFACLMLAMAVMLSIA